MRILVAYYSRSGKTEDVAKEIAQTLGADLDKVIDKKNRKGIFGWLSAGRDAMKENLTEIEHKKNPKDYDLVIVGTPTWASTITPAIRTYLTKHKFKKIAFFTTASGLDGTETFNKMKALSKEPVAILEMESKDFKNKKIKIWEIKKVKNFCDKIKNEK
jgi:flavodoxin